MDEAHLTRLAIAARGGDRASFQLLVESQTRRLIALAFRYTQEWESARMLGHAAGCAQCAMLLSMQRHLTALSPEELAAEVPPELVDGMWPRVRAAVEARRPSAPGQGPNGFSFGAGGRLRRLIPGRRSLVPVLTAAVMLLLLVTGFLLGEVRQLRQRERGLARSLARQAGQQEEQQGGYYLPSAPDLPRGPGAGWRWERFLCRREDWTAAQLSAFLAQLPPQTEVLDAEALESLLRGRPYWQGISGRLIPGGVQTEDGLPVIEVLRIVEALDLGPKDIISRAPLRALTRGDLAGRRSRLGAGYR